MGEATDVSGATPRPDTPSRKTAPMASALSRRALRRRREVTLERDESSCRIAQAIEVDAAREHARRQLFARTGARGPKFLIEPNRFFRGAVPPRLVGPAVPIGAHRRARHV